MAKADPDNHDRFRVAHFEHVTVPPTDSCIWRVDDYPWKRTVWNYHPEIEIHLIRNATGLAYVGDYIGSFQPGQVVMTGSNLPHNWISPDSAETISGRDLVIQFSAESILASGQHLPELLGLKEVFIRAGRGIELLGAKATRAALVMESMGPESGLSRLSLLLKLLAIFTECGETDYRLLATQEFVQHFIPGDTRKVEAIGRVLDFLHKNFRNAPSLAEAANVAGLSESNFSRLFRRQTGNSYVNHLYSLKIWTAKRLLVDSDMPITDICYEVGFNNISNFNRRFLLETGMTPSKYRTATAVRDLATYAPIVSTTKPSPFAE